MGSFLRSYGFRELYISCNCTDCFLCILRQVRLNMRLQLGPNPGNVTSNNLSNTTSPGRHKASMGTTLIQCVLTGNVCKYYGLAAQTMETLFCTLYNRR